MHDLQKLCDHLSEFDEQHTDELQSLVDALAEGYVTSRYPGFDLEDPDWGCLKELLDSVEKYFNELINRIH